MSSRPRPLWSAATAGQCRPELGMGGVVLFGPMQVLGRVDSDPEALVPEAEELSLRGQLGERRLFVVAALRHAGKRLVAQDIDAGIDPVRQARRFAESGHAVVDGKVDDAELRLERRNDDRRGAAMLLVRFQEGAQ